MDFCSEISFFFILLPHPGCCSLLPTAPAVSMLDSSTVADPAIVLVYACMLSLPTRERRHLEKSDIIPLDDAGLTLLPELIS